MLNQKEEGLKKFIDIDRIIRAKNPGLYKLLPGFLLNYIRKKLHEDDINQGMHLFRDLSGHAFNEAALGYLGAKVIWEGLENIPENGGVIIASNHPLGGLDGLALIKSVSRVRQDTRFIVNDLLKNFGNYGDIFVGVNKTGSSGGDVLRIVEEVYASDHAVLVFPAGLVSRKQGKEIKDLEWKKSFVSKALKYQKPIIPTFIDGQNSSFFYNLSLWRKRLGIKANIEMFFLADEMFRQKNKSIRVIFGKPILPDTLNKSLNHQLWAEKIKTHVYSIGKGNRSGFMPK